MNRVVITGYGVTSPIGNDANEFWESLHTGKVGIGSITKIDASETGISVAGEVKDFPFDKYFVKKDAKRMDLFSLYGIYAALEAVNMSGLDLEKINHDRFGVIVGSGIGGLQTIQDQVTRMNDRGPQRVAPLFIPMSIVNMAAGNIALRLGAKGICTAIVTACASATNSIGEAYRNIKFGYSDVIVAGGTEASITKIGIAGFASLTALSDSTNPLHASIPFDKERNGFVMGEGAGVFVLESLEHAQARGANILGEVVGYGSNCDAYHMTSPIPDGSGAAKAMQLALDEAGLQPSDIGYINAHGTSTQANEKGESKAIETVFGQDENVLVSSTKSLTGHLLGAAGGIEAIATLNALQHQFVPGTAGTKELDDDMNIHVVKGEGVDHKFDYAISNSLGFGGHNAVICLKKWSEEV
ncbi:MAG: beta-ketoacyl-ACP synthase II [Lactobacillales bacterium]|jgi:3-oxoacyl-[acyl-carrier-protein] synthase II|nr:beta-ketoacyl-ACP synthase II [Lactobacillales bacterium]